ncbi:MAG: hypothetical protein WC967_12100 [Balneolaceae bacterium]
MTEEEIIAEALVKIEQGVQNIDWSMVCEAYEDITGEKISPPSAPKSKLETIRKNVKSIKQKIDKEVTENEVVQTKEGNVTIVTAKNDPELAEEYKSAHITPRSRPKHTVFKTTCRKCGKEFDSVIEYQDNRGMCISCIKNASR